ncbi:MAG: SusD/RagB family nutrient-binding outer membrane lipoprotein, partial [Flavobacteriaceae bacterium]|nr:SusD/RagB family nutrient-binding outer membrane lipoprotein [Flavobacteriaceae bacterium]
MKTLNKISIIALTSLLVLSSCETTELDLTSNPNALSPAQASADLFMNEIQVDFAYMVNGLNGVGSRLTRINQLGGERLYRDAYSPNSF